MKGNLEMNAVFEFIRNIFAVPFGYVLGFFYDFTGSYLLAILLLTLLVRLCFLPFSVKQQKNLLERAKYRLEVKKIKKKYAADEEKIKEEIENFKANNIPPKQNMGCLTSIVQLVVLIGLFGVIYSPLSSALHMNENTVAKMQTVMVDSIDTKENSSMIELQILKETENYKNELLSSGTLTEEEFVEIVTFREKYTFFGVDLSESPKFTVFNALWLIPLAVLIVGISSRLYTMIRQKKYNPRKKNYLALEVMPFISAFIMFLFTFMFPAGVGLYWAISNLLSFAEEITLTTIYNPNKILIETHQLDLELSKAEENKKSANIIAANEQENKHDKLQS